ncbi:MAG: ATP-binding protein [Nanoarchaeota archaeon]|nr:ATP-binding protein [Nanoarchaeota archaeon]
MLQDIKERIILQKREIESKLKERYIERNQDLKLNNDLIKVIVGPRRAGKSFFAIHFLNKQGKFGYVNFDDEKLVEVENYDEIIAAINSVYDNPKFILFDEIQNLPKWELFVNRLQRQGHNLVITGSNSNLLSNELATHLTGRHLLTNIFPFSFKEYLKLETSRFVSAQSNLDGAQEPLIKKNVLDNKELTITEIKEKMSQYLLNGGYPEILSKKIELKEYLGTLFNSIIYKDIVKRYKIRNPREIEDLVIYFISNIANEYSYNSLTKVGKIKSSHTTEKYLKYLEESFILFSLNRFSYKVKEQLSSNKKIYCIDNGFIQAKAFRLSPDTGKLYENVVACKLKKEEVDGKLKFYYWKNQQQEEVDFIIKEGIKVKQLIQVCFNINNLETKNREIRALIKAGKELKCSHLLIITEDTESKEKMEWFGDKATINYIPLWKWLLT